MSEPPMCGHQAGPVSFPTGTRQLWALPVGIGGRKVSAARGPIQSAWSGAQTILVLNRGVHGNEGFCEED